MNEINKEELPEAVSLAASILFQLRAETVELMDLRGIKDVTDFFLVATCESEAQMQAILNELTKEFKARKLSSLGVEWIALEARYNKLPDSSRFMRNE